MASRGWADMFATAVAALAVLGACGPVTGQPAVERDLKVFRDMLSADAWANPAHLDADRGEALWKTARGPRGQSLEACDLGRGRGVVAGASAELPRYFADAGRVMDLEARIIWCMTTLQGFNRAELVAAPYAAPGQPTKDIGAIATYVAARSHGLALAPRHAHPRERQTRRLGEALYHRRQGPLDFSCATCHSADGKRIRLQELAHLSKPEAARAVMGSWPAYRASTANTMTLQQRLYDCFWQMRLPEVEIGSPVPVALAAYLAGRAEGGIVSAPGLKR